MNSGGSGSDSEIWRDVEQFGQVFRQDQILSLLRNRLNLPIRGNLLLSLNPDAALDTNDVRVRASVLLDVSDNGEIVLTQTEPMVLGSMIGSEVIISTIGRDDSCPAR